MVASKHMFLFGGRGLVTYFCAVGKRGRRFGGLIITSRIEYFNAGASLETSINIMLHDRS
jgi:hypothetical protein